MAKVFGHVVAPLCVYYQPHVRPHENRPTVGESGMVLPHETLEPLGTLEQINVARFLGRGQRQPRAKSVAMGRKFLEQPMMRGQCEIAENFQLLADQRVPFGQRRLLAPKSGATDHKLENSQIGQVWHRANRSDSRRSPLRKFSPRLGRDRAAALIMPAVAVIIMLERAKYNTSTAAVCSIVQAVSTLLLIVAFAAYSITAGANVCLCASHGQACDCESTTVDASPDCCPGDARSDKMDHMRSSSCRCCEQPVDHVRPAMCDNPRLPRPFQVLALSIAGEKKDDSRPGPSDDAAIALPNLSRTARVLFCVWRE